jgi:hypothetical protein
LGHGFVHLFGEESFVAAFDELDTITDFVGYRSAVESFSENGGQPRIQKDLGYFKDTRLPS